MVRLKAIAPQAVERDIKFQFLMVRLKGFYSVFFCKFSKFQFLMVRLKAPSTFDMR